MTSQKIHLNRLLAFVLAVILLAIAACNVPFNMGVTSVPTAARSVPVTSPPPTITPTPVSLTSMQQFINSLQPKDNAPVGLPTIIDMNSPGTGAQQQVTYFDQVLATVSKSKLINILTATASYATRALLPGETIQNTLVIQYVDSLTTAFALTTEKNGAHTYCI